MSMVTYERVWDALTTNTAEADDLHARSQLLHALTSLVHTRGWSVEEAARHLHLTPARTELLIAGDINAFSLDELRSLDDLTRTAVPGETPPPGS
jgi:predicted XRE-type DNA-binding protein